MNRIRSMRAFEMCPPRMSDGRNFTQYTPGCEIAPPNMTSNQARAYMIANAEKMMERNRLLANRDGCTTTGCFDMTSTGTALPELSYMTCDKRTCSIVPGQPRGLGMGRRAV